MSFLQMPNNVNTDLNANNGSATTHYYPCYAPVAAGTAPTPFSNVQPPSKHPATVGNHFYQAFTDNLQRNAIDINHNHGNPNSSNSHCTNNGSFTQNLHSNATTLMTNNAISTMPQPSTNLSANDSYGAAAVGHGYAPQDSSGYTYALKTQFDANNHGSLSMAACNSNTSTTSNTSNTFSYNSSTNTSTTASASAMDDSSASGGAPTHSFANTVKQEVSGNCASCACCCCMPLPANCNMYGNHTSNQVHVEQAAGNACCAAIPAPASFSNYYPVDMQSNSTPRENPNGSFSQQMYTNSNVSALGIGDNAMMSCNVQHQQQQPQQPPPQSNNAMNLNAANSTCSGTPAFVKHAEFAYPSYKQKYALNGSVPSASRSHQADNFSAIRHELYHHRKQLKRESILQSARADNHGSTVNTASMASSNANSSTSSLLSPVSNTSPSTSTSTSTSSPLLEIKIKGNNLDSLLKKLAKHGDDTYSCLECKKCFFQRCYLVRHIRDAHLVKTASHECPFCLKTFHQKSNLDTHCMTHAKDRKFSHPFKCLLCRQQGKEKCFTRKSSLKRHCQTKHKQENVEAEWINAQQTPKWDAKLKQFVFGSAKKKHSVNYNTNTVSSASPSTSNGVLGTGRYALVLRRGR